MTKRARAKAWAIRNEDKIIVVTFGVALVGLAVISVKLDMSYRERLTAELNGYIDELNAMDLAATLNSAA